MRSVRLRGDYRPVWHCDFVCRVPTYVCERGDGFAAGEFIDETGADGKQRLIRNGWALRYMLGAWVYDSVSV